MNDFITFALQHKVLKFGEFKLKSGRISPYFFHAAAMFDSGAAFLDLARFYAEVIFEHFTSQYDVLFGPAYKGIPLATATSMGLKMYYNQSLPVSFNRKEVKDHGEGGRIVGAPLAGQRVLLIDDVITAGTAIHESVEIINAEGGKLVGVVVALDRQERGTHSPLSAIQEIEKKYNLQVKSILSLSTLIAYLQTNACPERDEYLEKISAYRHVYGV